MSGSLAVVTTRSNGAAAGISSASAALSAVTNRGTWRRLSWRSLYSRARSSASWPSSSRRKES